VAADQKSLLGRTLHLKPEHYSNFETNEPFSVGASSALDKFGPFLVQRLSLTSSFSLVEFRLSCLIVLLSLSSNLPIWRRLRWSLRRSWRDCYRDFLFIQLRLVPFHLFFHATAL
jgi:hypothetical protein